MLARILVDEEIHEELHEYIVNVKPAWHGDFNWFHWNHLYHSFHKISKSCKDYVGIYGST